MEVATLEREVQVFIKQQSAASSALARSLLAGERFALQRDLEQVIGKLEADHARLVQLLRAEDRLWERRDADTGYRLTCLQHEFSFIGKWTNQLKERLFQLESGS
jgi:hypothetical protein